MTILTLKRIIIKYIISAAHVIHKIADARRVTFLMEIDVLKLTI